MTDNNDSDRSLATKLWLDDIESNTEDKIERLKSLDEEENAEEIFGLEHDVRFRQNVLEKHGREPPKMPEQEE